MNTRLNSAALALIVATGACAFAGDEHWSRQFKKPAASNKMAPDTGMADGTNKPIFRRAKWHDGKLWIAGAWENGVDPTDQSKSLLNCYWHIWTWSPDAGWEPFAWFHTAQGGNGPDGKVTDFTWLPDGRMVVVGEFTRLDNPGGIMYHRVDAAAVFNPKEPGPNKWTPLGGFQYDGTVSEGGSIQCVAYDPQGNDLYLGGSFGGIPGARSRRKYPLSPAIIRFDLDTNTPEPCEPGVHGAGQVTIRRIALDTSTKPTTVYVGGAFHYTGGNGEDPMLSTSTARYTTGFASYQQGKGWTWFPNRGIRKQDGGKEAILQRAGDYINFGSVTVFDILLDAGQIYIVGGFSEGQGSGQTLRGMAKWDQEKQAWVDPTGKGGFGREVFSIAKATNGKIYVAGAFGGPVGTGKWYEGFKNGEPAAMCASFDPKTGEFVQLGSGLAGRAMPECRLTVDGDDVYFVGDFNYIGAQRTGKAREDKDWESWYIARWNETRDFTKEPEKLPSQPTASSNHLPAPTQTWSSGNEHWSRAYPRPPRMVGKTSQMSPKTGMDPGSGSPNITGVVKVGETLYFCGRWEAERNFAWHVWSLDPKTGWQKLAFEGPGGQGVGPQSPPKGMKLHGGRLWVYGSIASHAGIASFDMEKRTWHELTGKTEQGQPVVGNSDPNKGSRVTDVAWDDKTGDMYLVGSPGGLENPKLSSPKAVGQVIRIDKDGVYHPMGNMLFPETPKAPNIQECIYLDTTKDPVDIYVGGTFNFYGGQTNNKFMAYNIVKWDYAKQDWGPLEIGSGSVELRSDLDKATYPNGLPGLPAQPTEHFHGFFQEGFPRVRCLTMDAQGNLYAGGTLAVISGTLPMAKRVTEETYGIAKYDAKTKTWGPCTKVGGLSRDVLQMTWLDPGKTQLLLSGSFFFDNAWNPLNGAAILDTTSGDLKPFGGGLLMASRTQVWSSEVVHWVEGDDIYFAGNFDYAGINVNDLVEAPIESSFVARWNATQNFDPNRGLVVEAVEPVEAPAGFNSKAVKIPLKAKLTDGEGTIVWYERSTSGQWREKGKGESFGFDARVKGSDAAKGLVVYVAVRRPDGTEGGKQPVKIPVVVK